MKLDTLMAYIELKRPVVEATAEAKRAAHAAMLKAMVKIDIETYMGLAKINDESEEWESLEFAIEDGYGGLLLVAFVEILLLVAAPEMPWSHSMCGGAGYPVRWRRLRSAPRRAILGAR